MTSLSSLLLSWLFQTHQEVPAASGRSSQLGNLPVLSFAGLSLPAFPGPRGGLPHACGVGLRIDSEHGFEGLLGSGV